METNKVVRAEARRVERRVEAVGALLLVMMALLTLVLYATVRQEASATREAINDSTKEEALEQMFDTQQLETWCKGEDLGTIRMVGAWVYSTNEDGTTTLEDEQGNLWGVDGTVQDNAFLLLWLADNHTAEVEDDVIIKVWCEWYAD